MKRFTLTFSLLCVLGALANRADAGSYAGKEVMQPAPPPCEWYRANEWNLDIWGTIAFPWNTGDRDVEFRDGFGLLDPDFEGRFKFDAGRTSEDRFINRDNAWGGGADLKYFFSKYWALGGEGFVVDANDNIGGAGLFTATFRFPIGCSRFAPYAWAGVGALEGGSSQHLVFEGVAVQAIPQRPASVDGDGEGGGDDSGLALAHGNFNHQSVINHHTLAIGQFGGGLEVRITRHIGVMGDFAWNVVQENDNDFGMARVGLTLSY